MNNILFRNQKLYKFDYYLVLHIHAASFYIEIILDNQTLFFQGFLENHIMGINLFQIWNHYAFIGLCFTR